MIALATDLTIEGNARELMPPGTQLHVTRITFENPITPESLRRCGPRLRAAAELIVPGVDLEGIIFGCSSASAVLGAGIAELVGDRAPLTTPISAALRGFRALGVRRIALMTPYMPETTDIVGDAFEGGGLTVVSRRSMGHDDDRTIGLLTPEAVLEAALRADHPEAEALFMSCTALPALPVIARIEARLGKPVLSSNQALFWAMLDRAGIACDGPGQLCRVRGC